MSPETTVDALIDRLRLFEASATEVWLDGGLLFRLGLSAGFVVDGLEEPWLPRADGSGAGVRWRDMPEIPPIMVARTRPERQ